MEFGIRELVQFGTLLASLAGAFAVVKSQLSRVIQDIAEMEKVLNDINTRIDQADADRAVIKHQNKVFSTILSPGKLEAQHREISELRTEMRVVHKNLDALSHMHNGRHPIIKGD
jgi:septal ring factor EnvC (AmiA/AmiB activator)|tara:strand:+ start:459 stop:803 length:345 start_codon:yes stop_codon:yes gene_type:complete